MTIEKLEARGFEKISQYNGWFIFEKIGRDLRIFVKDDIMRVGEKECHLIDTRIIDSKKFFRIIDRLICEYPKPVPQYPVKKTKMTFEQHVLQKLKMSFYGVFSEYAEPIRWFKRVSRTNFGYRDYQEIWRVWRENYDLSKHLRFVNQERV